VKEKSEEERQKSIKEESKPVVIEERFIPPALSILNLSTFVVLNCREVNPSPPPNTIF
jgi:hypothetical protein